MDLTRRHVLAGTTAAATAAVLPAVSEPEPGVFDWLEQVELDAIKRCPLPKRPAGTFIVTEMLTPEEIVRLRRKTKEFSAYARKIHPGLRFVDAKKP